MELLSAIQKIIGEIGKNTLRIHFIESCVKADIIPRFLKFRVPNNGVFNDKAVFEFQKRLIRKELYRSKQDLKMTEDKLEKKRQLVKSYVPNKLLPSVAMHSRLFCRTIRKNVQSTHSKKLLVLSEEQERPLFNVKNTVLLHELDETPPKFVMDTLSLGPKNSVLDKFEPKDVLAELDVLLSYCKENSVDEEIITDINIRTINYIKKCKKQKSTRNIQLTKRYLKENNLLAVPFDKGVGVCLMKKDAYNEKLSTILNLPQFEKVIQTRKNAKHPLLKEQERITEELKTLKANQKIDEDLYQKLHTTGSQPPRLYGLAKVHKAMIPSRPVLSMPGSVYHQIALQVTKWLSVVPECNINSSTKRIADSLSSVTLDEDEVIVSFDVTSLYTNVPVEEAIQVCTDMLYSGKYELPPVDKETFLELLKMCTCNVLFLTHDGYYRQKDGLAMGSPPAPLLANGWFSKHDAMIRGNAKLHARYMDDLIHSIKQCDINQKLQEINNIHPSLKFTIETEVNGTLPFLDMLIVRKGVKLSSTWYNKPTDTGLVMNYHSLAPKIYKRSVVAGFVYRIHRACSTWQHFHDSLIKAKYILEKNQYPPQFYEPIIRKALEKIINPNDNELKEDTKINENGTELTSVAKKLIFVQYRGHVTDDYCRSLNKCNAPCQPVLTLRKLRTVMPTLKATIDKPLRSHVVYKISCPRCQSCYIGQTTQYLLHRFKQHLSPSQPVGKHFRKCKVLQQVKVEDVQILAATTRSSQFLETLEALWQREEHPTMNTKDEYRSRELTIVW